MVETFRTFMLAVVLTAGGAAPLPVPPAHPSLAQPRSAPSGDIAQVLAVRNELTTMLVLLYERLEPFEELLEGNPAYAGIPSFRRIAEDLPALQTLLMEDAKRIRKASSITALRDAETRLKRTASRLTNDVDTWLVMLLLDIEQLEEDDDEDLGPPEPVMQKPILRT